MNDVLPSTTEDTPDLPSPAGEVDVQRIAKERLIPIALATYEEAMLSQPKVEQRLKAADSVMDRFGYPAKSQGGGAVVLPIPIEYLANMAKGLAQAFQGGSKSAIDVPFSPCPNKRLANDGQGSEGSGETR